MPDPNDFADKNTPEGEGGERGNPKAGQFGVGGLTTKNADDAYQRASQEHFKDETSPKQKQKNKLKKKATEKDIRTPPQVGSIEESEEQSFD